MTLHIQFKQRDLEIKMCSLSVISLCVYIVVASVFEYGTAVNNALSSYALFACLAICGVSIIRRKSFHWYRMDTCLFILGVILSISCLHSPTDADYMRDTLYRYWTCFVLAAIAANEIKTERDINAILNSFIVAGVCLSLVIYGFYGVRYLLNAGQRLQNGDFGNVNTIGLICSLSIVLAIYKLFTEKKHKVLLTASSVICLSMLMFTGSRKALLVLLAAIIVFVIVYFRNINLLKRILMIVFCVAAFLLLMRFVPAFAPIRERLIGTLYIFSMKKGNMVVGDAARIQYLVEGWNAFLKNPLFGNGFCYSTYLFTTYSHCNYIELLMNNGIIGFAAYYSVYAILILRLKNIRHDRKTFSFVLTLVALYLFEEIGVVDYYARLTILALAWIYKAELVCMQKKQDSED